MINKIRERIKYWSQIFLLPIYWFSFLVPKKKNVWLFGCSFGNRFADNPRYLYLYVMQNKSNEIQPIWISKQKGIVDFLRKNEYEAYYYLSLRGLFYALIAGVYIFDNYSKDINFWLSAGAIKVNLWHGSGNKKTNYDNIFDEVRHPKNKWESWKTFLRRLSDEKSYHYTLATSEAMADIFASAFQTDKQHIIVEGYPRNDVLFDVNESNIKNLLRQNEEELIIKIREWKGLGNRIIGYIPTFRNSESLFFQTMDLLEFNQYLSDRNYIFITKLHPKSKLKNQFEEIKYSNIQNADPEIDVYSFLGDVDMLVTDYSSVYTDYLLLNRPVVAFHYDWIEYCNNTRESYINHDEYMPEIIAKNMKELMESIDNAFQNDACMEKRLISKKRMFTYTDSNSSKRLFQKIYNLAVR